MTIEERKEKAILHKELVDLLTDAPDDDAYYKRLLWANQFIANMLSDFESDSE